MLGISMSNFICFIWPLRFLLSVVWQMGGEEVGWARKRLMKCYKLHWYHMQSLNIIDTPIYVISSFSGAIFVDFIRCPLKKSEYIDVQQPPYVRESTEDWRYICSWCSLFCACSLSSSVTGAYPWRILQDNMGHEMRKSAAYHPGICSPSYIL